MWRLRGSSVPVLPGWEQLALLPKPLCHQPGHWRKYGYRVPGQEDPGHRAPVLHPTMQEAQPGLQQQLLPYPSADSGGCERPQRVSSEAFAWACRGGSFPLPLKA